MLPFPIQGTCHDWVLTLGWCLLVWNRGIKRTKIFCTQPEGFSKSWSCLNPEDSAIPSWPSLATTAEDAWPRAELQPWPGGWGRRNACRRNVGSIGKAAQLYPVPVCFPSFPKNKKSSGFFTYLFIYFHFSLHNVEPLSLEDQLLYSRRKNNGIANKTAIAWTKYLGLYLQLLWNWFWFLCVFGFVVWASNWFR